MATNNAVNNGLTGATGTGNFVGSNSPTITTPTLNQSNSVGVTTNSNAASGSLGEYISSTVLVGSAVPFTNGNSINITSISLTAGDWDVCGTTITDSDNSTVITEFWCSISLVSDTLPVGGSENNVTKWSGTVPAGTDQIIGCGQVRLSLASTTTVYLVGQANFSVNTCSGYGFIGARRVR